MDIKLSTEDKKWLEIKYPNISIDTETNVTKSELAFDRIYKGKRIADAYFLQIEFNTKKTSFLPQVRETGGKIAQISKELSVPIIDLHVNEIDNTLCLCIDVMEKNYFPQGFNIKIFFEDILEPFLYWVSYYRKYRQPPWEDYAHGELGYFELYAEGYVDIEVLKKKILIEDLQILKRRKGGHECLCKSGKKLRDCHELIYKAIYKLKKELNG